MGELFERPLPPAALPWTGERLTSATTGQVEIEHLHRYFLARTICRGRTVLDIACGEGYGAAVLAQVAESVTGVDVSAETIAHAALAYAAPNLRFLEGDARRIPCADASFDIVVSFETIEHFLEHDRFIAEIRRVLRPGGQLVISSPERDVYSPAGSSPNPYHAHELTRAEFAALLHRTFPQVRIYGQRPLLGSALLPERETGVDGPFLTFERRDEHRFEASEGLPRPIYLVAVASDAPPAAPAGSLYIETSGVESIYAEAAAAKAEIASLRTQLQDTAPLPAQADPSAGLAAQLAQEREANASLARLVAELEAQADERRLAAAAERDALVAASAAQLQKRDARYARLEAAFRAELAQRAERAQAAEAEHRAELAALRRELAELGATAERASAGEHEIAGLRAYVAGLEHRLQAVLSSTSWHLTGPLRGFTLRHPGAVARVRLFLDKHPVLPRTAVQVARAGWRTVTLRNPTPSRREAATAVPPPPAPPPAEAPESLPRLRLERVLPAGDAGGTPLPAGNGRTALCVGHVMPWPPRAGNEYRIHRLLSWLAAEGWQLIVVICPRPHEVPGREQIAHAAAIYPNLLVLERDGTLHLHLRDERALPPADLGAWRARLRPLLAAEGNGSERAVNLQRTFCPDLLMALLLQLDAAVAPDLLLAEYVFMTRPFPLLRPGLLKAVDTIDLFSAKAGKVEQFAVSDGLALSAAEEGALLRKADILIAIQPEEAEALAKLAPEATVVSVGVDFPVEPAAAAAPTGRTLLLVASSNPMNMKGLEDFLRFAWPSIRRHDRAAEFLIAGAASEALGVLPDGVRAVGRVQDLRPLYAEARLVINPAIAGTGLKIKTVEALCHLRPVVCWPAGAEGLPPGVRRLCRIATDWVGFARHALDLLEDEDASGAVQRARDEVALAFATDHVYAPLRAALEHA